MIGGRFANLVVVPPQVAIVGARRAGQCVMVHEDLPAVRRVLPVPLTFYRRVVTGGEAAHFLVTLKADLERLCCWPIESRFLVRHLRCQGAAQDRDEANFDVIYPTAPSSVTSFG